jgi:GNAT superfamily N-acetyltransferase
MPLFVDTHADRLDRAWIVRSLNNEAAWGKWRTRSHVDAQIDSAWRVVGLYDGQFGEQVAFARAVSDGVGFAHLADLIVDPDYRGSGLGRRVVDIMIEQGPGSDFRWSLFTEGPHGMFGQFGFLVPGPDAMVRPER